MSNAVLVWIWSCAYLNCAGWALSAIHQLNAGGYAVVLTIWLTALILWRKREHRQILPCVHWQKIRNRFQKPFPLAFLILATITFLGGAIYAPNNYDALAYRIPRVLHWLAADQWHWVHTTFQRINTRACGIEWVSAPLIALLRTDRALFLINVVSFLLLPGLIFTVFTRLGMRRRVAWHWMWIVPSGYCFLLQAGSIGNDLFGAVFALAAVDFALRAKGSNLVRDFYSSVLAAALLTSSKTSNLALLLPWAIAILPSIRLALKSVLTTSLVCVIALFASLAPTMFLNNRFSGDWTGMKAEEKAESAPVVKAGANIVLIATQNCVPPVFPLANKWNSAIEKNLPLPLRNRLAEVMEGQINVFHLDEIQIEERAGLGFGVSVLLLASVAATFFKPKSQTKTRTQREAWIACVRWSPMVSLVALMTQSNLVALARLLTPYYSLLLPALLTSPSHERLVRKRWWRAAALAVFCVAAVPLILAPARPLFPIMTILTKTRSAPERVREVYTVYHGRSDAFAPAREILPPNLQVLGLITSDDPETSLWRPFGSRRVIHVCPEDTSTELKSHGVEYVLVKTDEFGTRFPTTFDDWLVEMNAQTIRKIPLGLRAAIGSRDWYLVRLN